VTGRPLLADDGVSVVDDGVGLLLELSHVLRRVVTAEEEFAAGERRGRVRLRAAAADVAAVTGVELPRGGLLLGVLRC
jgi:hypothetical protein